MRLVEVLDIVLPPLDHMQVLTNAVTGSLDVARTFEESAERAYAAMLKVQCHTTGTLSVLSLFSGHIWT